MTDEDVIRKLCSVADVGHVTGPRNRGDNRKPIWYWYVTAHDDVERVLSAIYSHLGSRRRAKVDQIRKEHAEQKARRPKTISCARCNEVVEVYRAGPVPRYCSQKCSEADRLGYPLERQCLRCGKTNPKGRWKFCSDECSASWWSLQRTPQIFVTPDGLERWTNVHPVEQCTGEPCVIHAPSSHPMRPWPMHLRETGLVERICEHGVAHPDPDSLAFFERCGFDALGVHGCDGCCAGSYIT